ncbi:hypothetical protein BDY19DRAFT_982296 [Irpex rosettiformis]|uniref:Uncharacterized protein n=1 Tax=Irpex rosettiformis TaxID=378272 RepID=A0ACB8UL08_9APHY|nr:hypothetical protein BDY19DRAFT_982296 [Irpex rosettiformis]
MSAPTAVPPLPSSSSTTLWATPSKEWVIPPKPKPGRKPKKDTAQVPADDTNDVDAKGRRVQNRAAQRAFRERKQSQLAELQARVQQYEQGKIERNVALQSIAKRLKEENEKLRKENALLQQKLTVAEEERDNLREMSRKRWRDESVPQTPAYGASLPSRKKSRTHTDIIDAFSTQVSMPSPSYLSSPATSVASSPGSNDHTSFSPIPSLPPPRDGPVFAQGSTLSNVFDFIASGKTNVFEPGGPLDTFNCGFCSDGTPCVCRELALQQVNNLPTPSATFKAENSDNTRVVDIRFDGPQLSPQDSSILENLPAYQPPVPLRRRGQRINPLPVFPITQTQQSSIFSISQSTPSCTGDPTNCPACADDAFGKAFCAAISKSVASSSTGGGNCSCGSEGCDHILRTTVSSTSCCGNPNACCRARENATPPSTTVTGPSSFALQELSITSHATSSTTFTSPQPQSPQGRRSETIPCDDAWRQIKSHPNIAFADLDLLAEVVARRVKCTGSRVEIFPAPGSITPERGISPLTVPTAFSQEQQQRQHMDVQVDTRPGSSSDQQIMSNHHHHFSMQNNSSGLPMVGERERAGAPSPPLQLVPQEVLVQCGRQQRVREVHADAVRDALRLLDAKFSLP